MIEPAIQIHPMVPLAKASAILKISRDELIARLSAGELMGEKRRIGESKKDSWFIYADEFNRLMAQAVAKYEDRVTVKGLEHIFSTKPAPPVVPPPPLSSAAQTIEAVTEPVAIQPVPVGETDDNQAEIVDALSPVQEQTGLQIGQAMVAQLVQHLQEERQTSENLKVRLMLLEEEVDQMRREMLGRPDSQSQNPVSRFFTYFRFLLGNKT